MDLIHKAGNVVGIDKNKKDGKEEHEEGLKGAGLVEDNKKKSKKKEEADVAIQMASGDYLIHVFIEEAKQLDTDDGSNVLCAVNITGFDIPVTYSSVKENYHQGDELTWNEHLFVQSGKQEKDKVQDARIEIKVQAKSDQLHSQLIGMYEFSLENIYQKKEHAKLHQWVALIDNSPRTKSISDVTGYLKLSIQVTGPKDKNIEINEDQTTSDPSEETNVMMPIQAKPKFLQMNIRIFTAQQLPEMANDALIAFSKNKMDGYVKAKVAGKTLKTTVITMGENKKIEWNQQIQIAVMLPLIDEYLKLEIWDENKEIGATDSIIGSIPIKLSRVLEGIYDEPFWQNIYGAPVNNSKEDTKQMNQNPELASRWKGRILMQIEKRPSTQQRFLVQKIPANVIQSALVVSYVNKMVDYEIVLDFGMGIALPKPVKFKMGFQMTSKQWVSELAKNKEDSVKGGFNMYSERQTLQFKLPYDKIEQIGKCFLYLIYENKTISYKRFRALDFTKPKPEWSYHELTPDPSIGELSDRQSGGIVSFRAYLRKVGDEPPASMMNQSSQSSVAGARQSVADPRINSSINSLSQSTLDYGQGHHHHVKVGADLRSQSTVSATGGRQQQTTQVSLECFSNQGCEKIEHYMIEKSLPRRAKSQKVRAYIYQCKDLPAADDDGLSDPFIQIWDQYKEVKKTPVVQNSLNPIYYIVREFYYDVFLAQKDQSSPQKIVENFPPIIIDIWDSDKKLIGSDSADFMCRSTIYVKDGSCRYIDDQEQILHQTDYAREKQINDDKAREMKVYTAKQQNLPDTDPQSKNFNGLRPPIPKWHECRLYPGAPVSGYILVSFDISEADTEFKTPCAEMFLHRFITMNQILFEIQVLGLRNLHSVGILPVKKATMNFGFANLLPVTSEITVKSIKTDPGPAGPNPTINSLISHKMPLPEDQLLCPALTVTVHDNIFNGHCQPMIGNFVIPLGDILFEGNEKTQHEINKLQDLVEKINGVVEQTVIPDYTNTPARSLEDGKDEDAKSQRSHQSQKSKKSEAEFSETPDPFAHLQNRENGRQATAPSRSRATARKRAEKRQREIDAERDDKLNDPHFEAEKHLVMIETELVDRTRIQQLHDELGERFVPSLEKVCEELGDDFHPDKFDAEQKKLIQEYAYLLEVHYQTAKKAKENEENADGEPGPPLTPKGHGGRLDAVAIAALNKKVAEDKQVAKVCKLMEDHVNKNRKNNLEHATRQIDALRARAQGEYERKDPLNAARVVVEPKFEMNERLDIHVEVDEPPHEIFMALGYNKHHEDGNKQYRKYYYKALEDLKEIMPTRPFDTYDIKRGQVRGNKKGLFSVFKKKKKKTADGEIDSTKSMGLFKGIVHVYTQQQKDKQLNEKKQHIQEIFEAIQKLRDKLDKTDEDKKLTLNLDLIQTQEGRVAFRNKMLALGLGHLNILKKLMNVEAENFIKRQLSIKQGTYVNCYVLTGRNLASRDIGSESDPYIKIKLGNKKQDTRKEHFDDEPNPDFYQKFTFDASFPGAPALRVAAVDYDALFGDDLIGETLIDLEDRFYSHHWQSWPQKPIETRQLYHPSSTRSQGELTCFVDILPESAKATTPDVFIEPEPEQELEVRVCVYNTTEVKAMDIEGTSDVYFECYIDNKKKKLKTDVHYRCMDGNASFNYRLKLYYRNTKESERQLYVRCFDRDLIGKNEFIGASTIDLWEPINDCLLTKRPGQVNKKYYNNHLKHFDSWKDLEVKWEDNYSFWVKLYDTEKGKQVCNGKVRLRIDLLTKEEADEHPLGGGRKELNQDPHLPPPEGRLEFSMNPLKMLKQMVSPQFLKKCQKFFCCIICLAIAIYFLPGLIDDVFGDVISKMF